MAKGEKMKAVEKEEKPDIQAALDSLREEFSKKIPGKVTEIRESWKALQAFPDNGDAFQLMHRLVHTLVGSAATYGFESVADCAQHIELTLQSLPEQPSKGLPVTVINDMLVELEEAVKLDATKRKSERAILNSFPAASATHSEKGNLIYLVDDDIDCLNSMKMQIEAFGYQVETFSELKKFDQALSQKEPSAVVMDIMFENSPITGIEHITRLNAKRTTPLDSIFITGSGDTLTRLSAVRANGQAYFVKPVRIEQLIESLNALTHQTVEAPFNIIIVEDSESQSQYIAKILQEVGMKTREVNSPLGLLKVLADYPTDLILMDLYMPDCTGLELSQVVRQIEAYVSLPIVFLSTEQNLAKQLGALSLGGDDFLSKPIEPWHLISAVTSRAIRGRKIRKLAEIDGLTGLINHNKCKERLETELARAKREKTPLSFAMIDIDYFKGVNDSYGHPAGDQVLKSLASMLKQRLRQYDIIGRYGGEEFAVIFPNTTSETAQLVLDSVRVNFSEINHSVNNHTFNCHFSCGIASYPNIKNSSSMINEADKNLYRAKNSGRNKVIIES